MFLLIGPCEKTFTLERIMLDYGTQSLMLKPSTIKGLGLIKDTLRLIHGPPVLQWVVKSSYRHYKGRAYFETLAKWCHGCKPYESESVAICI